MSLRRTAGQRCGRGASAGAVDSRCKRLYRRAHQRRGPPALATHRAGEIFHGREALLRFLGQGPLQRGDQVPRNVGPQFEHRRRRLEDVLVQDAVGGAVEGLLPGENLVADDGERILIGPAIDLEALWPAPEPCSAGVPMMVPVPVSCEAPCTAFEMPKSVRTTRPSSSIMMLAGFTSR